MSNSLADLDLFPDDFTASSDDSIFQYNEDGADPFPTSPAWDLDDPSLSQQGALFADTLVYNDACASDDTEPGLKIRARGPECANDEIEATDKPRRKNEDPSWSPGSHQIRPADTATSLEEFTCHLEGYNYAVCDSGDPTDIESPDTGQYCSLSHCDLCMLVGKSLAFFPALAMLLKGEATLRS